MTKYRLQDSDDVGYDIIVAAGQSNQVGQGQVDTAYFDVTDPRVLQYAGSGTYLGQVVAAVEPLFHHIVGGLGHAGAFAKRYARSVPVNRQVLLVPTAHGGTGFTTTNVVPPPTGYHAANAGGGTWDPTNADGGLSLYEFTIAQANAAMASGPAPSKNRLVAILWHQGEADCGLMTQATYAAALDSLIAGFRARITGASATTPFLLGQMEPDGIAAATSGANAAQINAAHIDTPRRNTRCAFYYGPAGAAFQNGDNTHYNAAGQRILALNEWPAWLIAKANVLGTAPIAPVAPTFVQAGTSVTASWVRPVCRATDYNVRYSTNGGTSWTTLTRAQSIDNTATITGLTLGGTVTVQVRTVNEQGISAWSPSGVITLINPPGQVTGLTLGTMGSVSAPLSWSAVSAATSYLVEYKLHSASPWTTSGTVTGLTATVAGLIPVNSYDFRVTAQNAGGLGTPSSTVTGSTLASSPLLADVGVAAFRAYGLRKEHASATKAIKVRRDSDNTTQDIAFAANGIDLDATSLLAFVGSGSGFIDTWYDQSQAGHDLQQTTAAKQARIVNVGTLDTAGSNSRAMAFFDGSRIYNDVVTGNQVLFSTGVGNTHTVLKQTTATGVQYVIDEQPSGGATGNYAPLYVSSGSVAVAIKNSTNATLLNQAGTSLGTTNPHVVTTADGGTTWGTFVDGAQVITQAYSHTGSMGASPIFALGGSTTFASFIGYMGEVVIWTTALTTAQRQAAEQNAKSYYGTP